MPRTDSTFRAYLELLRLPNVFTAMADVMMGYWFVTFSVMRTALPPARISILLLLLGASSCLYLAGMVLNDFFDRDKDARERPARPIPSRRVPESAALWLGSELLIVGVALAWTASYFVGGWRTGLTAFGLAAAVVLYDASLKKTPLGPVGMGACRMLNVLMGMSAVSASQVPFTTVHFVVAGGIGLYIVGVTWFARTEAVTSNRIGLAAGCAVMLLGIAALAWFPNTTVEVTLLDKSLNLWYLFWAILAAQIAWRCVRAIFDPSPRNVQFAIKQCLLSLIILDAAVTFSVQGHEKALVILALLLPTMFLGRFIYST